jgi:polar amino acid transport system ATP-binding protein/sulfate transport system ATP-binding protein
MSYEYTYHKPLIQVQNVNVTLGGKCILRDVDFTVRDVHRPGHTQGQIVALLGPSGMGKSQLFRRIAGLEPPDSGSIKIGAEAKPTAAGLVGVVMQHYPLFPHRSVLGNLVVAGTQAGLDAVACKAKALGLLEQLGMTPQADSWPAQLSGGQRQRVAIAQQLMCSEHLLLMDEPFSGLDILAKQAACKLISEVAAMDELNTIVVVTHDIESAVHIADQVLVLGRERDKEGKPVPGARIQADIDLKARGIAWRENNESLPAFQAVVQEVKTLFPRL